MSIVMIGVHCFFYSFSFSFILTFFSHPMWTALVLVRLCLEVQSKQESGERKSERKSISFHHQRRSIHYQNDCFVLISRTCKSIWGWDDTVVPRKPNWCQDSAILMYEAVAELIMGLEKINTDWHLEPHIVTAFWVPTRPGSTRIAIVNIDKLYLLREVLFHMGKGHFSLNNKYNFI